MTQLPDSKELLKDPYYLNIEKRLVRISLAFSAGILIWALLFRPWAFACSFLVGAMISYCNFNWMKQGVDHMLSGFQPRISARRRPTRGVIIKYFLRYALIGGALYAIFALRFFDVTAAILGLLLFVMAVIYECIHQVVKTLVEDRRGRA